MNTAAVRANRRKLLILAFLVLLCAAGYMLVEVNFSNPKLLAYIGAVEWAVAWNITTGTDEDHFSPDTICNRAQIVTFLYRTYQE